MPNPLIRARNAFAAQHPEQHFSRDGRDWGVLDVGAGPALLLLPGTLGRADIFWQQVEALAGRLRIVALSYPETGGISAWAEDIAAILAHLGIARAQVLGSSLGGYLAQYFAAVHPGQVTGLIAANTLADTSIVQGAQPYVLDLENTPIETLRAGFTDGLSGWAKADPEATDVVELLLEEVDGRISPASLRARLAALKEAPALPEIPLPESARTSIECDDDPLIPPPLRAGLRAALHPAVAYRFRHGRHFPYLTRPDAYTALLEQVMGLEVHGPDWGDTAERVV